MAKRSMFRYPGTLKNINCFICKSWVFGLQCQKGQISKFFKIRKQDHFSNQLIELIPKMPKFLKKVHFLKKFASENQHGFTSRQIFLVQKVAIDPYMIEYKFQKNCSIRFRIENLVFGHKKRPCANLS